MRALELLEIVNDMATPQESYQIYHNLGRKLCHGLDYSECMKPIRDFFLGEDRGECHLCRWGMFLTHEHFLLIFLDKDSDGELYHDFIGCDGFDEPIFEGIDEWGQTLRVYTLE